MQIRKFDFQKDFSSLESFLRKEYIKTSSSMFLPERLHDLIYRVSALEEDDDEYKSLDYIYLSFENEKINAAIIPDGENIYFIIDDSMEDKKNVFSFLLSFSEKEHLFLFHENEDHSKKFFVAVNEKFSYMEETLLENGYEKYPVQSYDNVIFPLETSFRINLPEGFHLLYGEDYLNEENKWNACRLGFHPEMEESDYCFSMNPY